MGDPTSTPRAGGDLPPASPQGPDLASASLRRHDQSPWNWLLIIPIIVPLIPVFFNAETPTLFGFPRFYWLQLCFIGLGVATTTLVYQMTKRRPGNNERAEG